MNDRNIVSSATPVQAAWRASPDAMIDVACTAEGACGGCGADGLIAPAGAVVSNNFVDWDRLGWPHHADGFCAACTWGFRHRPLRQQPWTVGPDGLTWLTPPQLGDLLSRPLAGDRCVVVPIRRQKHIAPFATWGQVCTDSDQHPWTTSDVELLDLVRRLRALGFGEQAIAEPAPRWPLLRRLDVDEQHLVLARWAELDGWRRRGSPLAVAVRATRSDQKGRP